VVEALLKAVSNAGNRAILGLLAVEPTYPRRIGILLGLPEGEVARRLQRLERLGLVASRWERQGERRNVKLYRLAASSLTVRIEPAGIRVDVEGASRAAQPMPVASNIPRVETFIGREAELGVLGGPDPVVLVLGMPGVGKTTLLARHAAAQERPVFWRSFRGVESVTWLANQVALFLGTLGDRSLLERLEADPSPAAAAQATLEAMERSEAVFVLDDAHRADDPAVRALLADAVARVRHARVLVGSRDWIAHDPSRPGLRVLRLAGLPDTDAVRLLEARGVTVPPALVARLHQEAGGHPLALNLLAQAALQSGDLERLLDRVPETDLEGWLVEEIDARLSDDERLVLAHASLFRTPFTAADLVAISGKRLEGAMTRLRRRMLILDAPGGHALGEVVQNHFYAKLQDKKALHAKAAAHALAKGTLESRLEAMHHFLAAGDRGKVLELVERNLDLHDYAFIDAGYHRLYQTVLSAFTRAEVHDDRHWALIQDEKGDILLHGGDAAAALPLYQDALATFRKAKDAAGTADAGWKLALCLERLGRPGEAREACEEAIQDAPKGQARERLEDLRARLAKAPRALTA
jgi:tetratricopeptide (TPR) repeat protein/DNA-binding transcriptional ArsR family regulator